MHGHAVDHGDRVIIKFLNSDHPVKIPLYKKRFLELIQAKRQQNYRDNKRYTHQSCLNIYLRGKLRQ